MNGRTQGQTGSDSWSGEMIAFWAVLIAALALSPLMLALALALGFVRRVAPAVCGWRCVLVGVALVGLVVASGLFSATWVRAWDAATSVQTSRPDPGALGGAAWAAAQPQAWYAWLLLLPLAPLFAWLFGVVVPREAGEQVRERQRRDRRRHDGRERRATRKATSAPLTAKAGGEEGIVLARRIGGERALPTTLGGLVVLSPARLCRHVLIAGATGAGKTETALRIAYTLAASSQGVPVFYLDAKGDQRNAARFHALMGLAGRRCVVFPQAAFDGWRGGPQDLQNRLLEVAGLPAEGDAVWYRYIADLALGLACNHPDGPPRSSQLLLERLDLDALKAAHGATSEARSLSKDKVSDVRLRYASFFGQVGAALDGTWAWEDTDAAYLALPGLGRKDERGALARFLFEDFSHYFAARKAHGRLCLLVVDEFSAIAQRGDMAERIEQARSFNAALILIPQAVAGMGGEEQAARILASVETIVMHRTNTPEELAALAGTSEVVEYSQQTQDQMHTGAGTARTQHQYKIDLNQARALSTGSAYIINRGHATKARIIQAPQPDAPALPAPGAVAPADRLNQNGPAQAPPSAPTLPY